MTNKIKKIILIFAVLLSVVIVMLGWNYWKNSTKHQVKILTEAIEKKDYEQFKEVVPSFADGKKINKRTFAIFAGNFSGESKETNIEKYVTNSKIFTPRNQDDWREPTQFLPYPRYVDLEIADTTTVTLSVGSHLVENKNEKAGPLIGANYEISYGISSSIYGKSEEKHRENLTSENQTFDFDEQQSFVQSKDFQEQLLKQVVSYYVSMNQGIQNDLNFENLDAAQKNTKALLQYTFDELRPYAEMIEQSFQEFIMNTESLKIEGSDEPTVTFDLYTDNTLSVDLKTEEDKQEETLSNSSHNAIVTLQFDEDMEEWLVQSIDFETYAQEPSDWQQNRKFQLSEANKVTWQEKDGKQADL
ncbi:hypothetical protein AC806_08035 [Tetragenococcus halophilus]|uniref:hypothetical protein n=1 Tax=Tetragenococcus halophilus TaxID=51669 RepID=UPI00083D5544|nr:hypothetical protein [Tetragenococcus halophilus]AOF49325.1 hypothetical protein AC806_08035 [Tetragenococcus halophilus]